jgi:hypothetical protein
MRPTRREFLLAAVALAGCTGTEAGDDERPTADSPTMNPTPSPTDENGTDADGGSDPDLDLREANVIAVEWEGAPGDDIRFDVTLLHDDDGEDGYANWWQVETIEGDRLGRRDLLHAHGTAEFTRSETIAVPAASTCVVVRGHDQTHGYGGRAMLVNLDTGATSAIDQGAEARAFTAEECP